MLKKNEYTKNNLLDDKLKNIFICPICKNNIKLHNSSLICTNGHCFDITRKGYFTLLQKNRVRIDKMYDLNLFKNRISFINNGFYDELHLIISEIINHKEKGFIIVDMGCGDGTHDNKILNLLDSKEHYIIGADISRIGIECSSDYVNNNFIPVVCDLNYLPLSDNCADIILNILSPSNEREMKRVLKQDGIIIKVTPKKEYLKELREIFNIKEYENEIQIEENIKSNYIVLKKYVIKKTKDLTNATSINLINMTPLTKNYKEIRPIKQVTIAFNVYVLKVRNNYNV